MFRQVSPWTRCSPAATPAASRRRRTCLLGLALGAGALLTSGCVIVDDDHCRDGHCYDDPYDGYYDGPVYETIDADQIMETQLGEGVGLFVEYRSGGTWRVWTSCDTVYTGYSCVLDTYMLAGSSISNVSSEGLESYDYVDQPYPDELIFYAETGADSDAIEFDTDPGVSLELELVLDDYVDPTFIYWVGDGRIHEGASSSPVIFEPDSP